MRPPRQRWRGSRARWRRTSAPLGIRVNAIAPGEIDTPILSPGIDGLLPAIPMARLGKPSEVASAIYFLCSDTAGYITGGELHVNGGEHV